MVNLAEWLQLAAAQQRAGNSDAAERALRQALSLAPRDARIRRELAWLLFRRGNREAGIDELRRATAEAPSAPLHNDLGMMLREAGHLDEAVASFQKAIHVDPALWQAQFNLGNAHRQCGQFELAVDSYMAALRHAPDDPDVHSNLGVVQKEMGQLDRARNSFERALAIQPDHADALINLGAVCKLEGNVEVATDHYRRALAINPRSAIAHNNLGLVFDAQHDWEQARRHFLEALRIRPQYAEPHCSLGIICLAHGDNDEALAHFERALEIDPECPEAHYNRGVVLLGRGDYEAGWPEYAWRPKCSMYGDRKFDRPAWDGSPLEGRTLLIHCNFGMGDTLQFVRYLPEVRRRGAGRILLAAQPALHPLLAEARLGELVPTEAEGLEFDTYVSVMDLPCVFRSTDETIPAAPYLRASAARVTEWREVLSALGGLQVGIAWQGNRRYPWDHLRSIPLAQFEPLARVPGVRLISLQKGDGCEQLPLVAGRFDVTELGDEVDRQAAFMDTAAIIANLDLVVASDSAVAHLAGALGAPVWAALPVATDWRWQQTRDTTPWYPTMRLFRQVSSGDWSGIFNAMAEKLNSVTHRRRPLP